MKEKYEKFSSSKKPRDAKHGFFNIFHDCKLQSLFFLDEFG